MRLFEDYGGQVIHRIPQFDFIGKYGLTFNELFLIIFAVKAKIKGKKNALLLKKEYTLLLIFVIYLWLLSFIYGFDSINLISDLRKMLYLTLFYSIPRLYDKRNILFTVKIFFIVLLLTIANQITSATISFNIADEIAGKHWIDRLLNPDLEYIRAYEPVFLQFFIFLFGLLFYTMPKPPIKKKYAILFIFLSTISIIMTGTRGWILAFSICLFYYFFFIEKQKLRWVMTGITAILVLGFVLYFVQPLSILLKSNVQRFATLESMARGDMTAEGTLQRITVRLPRVMEGVRQNPVLGWGFSKTFYQYSDGHVGWANQILQMGLIGLSVFIIFWIRFWKFNQNLYHYMHYNNIYKKSILVFNIGLLCLLIIHSTAFSFFNFNIYHKHFTLVILFFLFADMWAKAAIEAEKGLDDKTVNYSAK